MPKNRITVPKTWRSEYKQVIAFIGLSAVSIYLTNVLPWSVIRGTLFSIGDSSVVLSLPMFGFVPFLAGFSALYRIYNVKYVIDSRGIEARVGILAVNQRITRVRFEDIRSVETEQTLMERIMDIGQVEIGTAATGEIEILFDGIAAPLEVQDMIQAERDKRQRLARKQVISVQQQASA